MCLILSYIAIVMLKFGDGSTVKATGFTSAPYVYTFVILNPLLSAAGQIAIKKMSHLPAMAVVWWNQISTLFVSTMVVYMRREH